MMPNALQLLLITSPGPLAWFMQVLVVSDLHRTESAMDPALFQYHQHFEGPWQLVGKTSLSEVRQQRLVMPQDAATALLSCARPPCPRQRRPTDFSCGMAFTWPTTWPAPACCRCSV